MRFVDEARIKVKAGDGGSGVVAWRREKFVPMGGPAGGNGGKGGNVVFVAKSGMNSLLDLKQQSLLAAEDGLAGQSKNKAGRQGRDREVLVPVGTQVVDESSPDVVQFDLTEHNQRVVICRGGDGGFGNAHFKSIRCSAPHRATEGFKGEIRELKLTLKMMADVGLLGFPNAGKSTLLSRLSNARPKVADYPFTTIKPMVGVCEVDIGQTMVVADIPGLIEGASLGHGLGFRFLRHLERVRLLCHVLDGTAEDDLKTRFLTINRELAHYSEHLASLTQLVVINKIDAMNEEQQTAAAEFLQFLQENGIAAFCVSAVTGDGIVALKHAMHESVLAQSAKQITKDEDNKANTFDPLRNLY